MSEMLNRSLREVHVTYIYLVYRYQIGTCTVCVKRVDSGKIVEGHEEHGKKNVYLNFVTVPDVLAVRSARKEEQTLRDVKDIQLNAINVDGKKTNSNTISNVTRKNRVC